MTLDAIVIAGGPAGLSAATWLARYRRGHHHPGVYAAGDVTPGLQLVQVAAAGVEDQIEVTSTGR